MKFFVDTADVKEVQDLNELGLVDGVTTNPSLILKSARDILEVTKEICGLVKGPVSAEVTATDYLTIMKEAAVIAKIADNVCIKLPMTFDGLKTCKSLSSDGYKTNVTLWFSSNQALLAAKAGATFVSPFIGRLDDIALNGLDLIREIRRLFDNYGFETEILAASARTVNHIKDVSLIGADVVTASAATLKSLVKHPLSDAGLANFLADWAKTGQKIA